MNPEKKVPTTSLVKVIRRVLGKVKAEVDKLRGKQGNKVESTDIEDSTLLKTYGRDLVKQAAKLSPLTGWDEEIKRVVKILSSRGKKNPVLVGEPGVGKTAVVVGLALRIANRDVPSNLADVRLIALDMGALVAGAKYQREFEGRLYSILKEVEKANGKVILFIDDVHKVFESANLFKEMLARDQLRCIGATTPEQYRKHDVAFKMCFQQQVHVDDEPSVPDTISTFSGLKEKYEGHHGGVKIQKRAISKLEGSGTENGMLTKTVGPDQIAEVVSQWTGIPVTRLSHNENERSKGTLGERLQQRVVGQDQAVTAVANAVLWSRAGLGWPHKPIGSFLFLGPTGVGKTELAKALAEQLCDDDNPIVRINLDEEYMEEQHSVAQLTEAVRRRPYSVVLLYDVEKAQPSVVNTLLRVLDDGRLTDTQGRKVDFTNTVIIINSKLGAEYLLMGKSTMEISAREMVMQEVRKHFKPELLDRLDEIVVFDPFSHDQARKVCRLMLKNVASRLAKKGIALGVTETAIDVILAASYDPVYGAFSMRRWLEDRVVSKIVEMFLREENEENSTVHIDAFPDDGKELNFRIEKNGVDFSSTSH